MLPASSVRLPATTKHFDRAVIFYLQTNNTDLKALKSQVFPIQHSECLL